MVLLLDFLCLFVVFAALLPDSIAISFVQVEETSPDWTKFRRHVCLQMKGLQKDRYRA